MPQIVLKIKYIYLLNPPLQVGLLSTTWSLSLHCFEVLATMDKAWTPLFSSSFNASFTSLCLCEQENNDYIRFSTLDHAHHIYFLKRQAEITFYTCHVSDQSLHLIISLFSPPTCMWPIPSLTFRRLRPTVEEVGYVEFCQNKPPPSFYKSKKDVLLATYLGQ